MKEVIISFNIEDKDEFENLVHMLELYTCSFVKVPKEWEYEE
jgi:hypothetical protein